MLEPEPTNSWILGLLGTVIQTDGSPSGPNRNGNLGEAGPRGLREHESEGPAILFLRI